MKTVCGVWIDHRRAVLVTLSDTGEVTREILSNVEKHKGRIEGKQSVAPYESKLVDADNKAQREYTGQLEIFYSNVFEAVKDADSFLLIGPGEVKGHLKKFMEDKKHSDRTITVETADKMTDAQIVEKVRNFFKVKDLR